MRKAPEYRRCALCERVVETTTRHHIIPRTEGGTQTVDLCVPCHKTLHAFFTNQALATEYNNLDRLRDNPEIQTYLKWIRKQPDRRIQVRKPRHRQ